MHLHDETTLAAYEPMKKETSDWEEENEEARRAQALAPAAETDPAGGAPRGVQLVVMGRPGSQKHAHAARRAEVLDVPYIFIGTLVRQELGRFGLSRCATTNSD